MARLELGVLLAYLLSQFCQDVVKLSDFEPEVLLEEVVIVQTQLLDPLVKNLLVETLSNNGGSSTVSSLNTP